MAVVRDFALPDRPDHPAYKRFVEAIESDPDRERARRRWRYVAERDFWFFCASVTNMRDFRIKEPTHPMKGKRWIDHPWLFARCREFQEDIELERQDCAYNLPRFHYKTTVFTIHGTEWELLRDPSLTFGWFTHKKEGAGNDWFSLIMAEFETNDVMLSLWPDRLYRNKRLYRTWNLSAISILRPPGIREPSVSVHAIDTLPTNAHYHRIVGDDIVVRETLNSPEAMKQAEDGMQNLRFLANENTLFRWVYTVYDESDPNQQREREGRFTSLRKWGCYSTEKLTLDGVPIEWEADSDPADWTPVLHSREFIESKRKELNPYLFSCQMMSRPIARGRQGNRLDWVKRYPKKPADQLSDQVRYLCIDAAGEKKDEKESDFWTWWVVGPGADGNLYCYDYWRERLIQDEGIDLTFSLVRMWKPARVYLEGFGADHLTPAIRREMGHRRYQFTIVPMNDHKPKVRRIQELQGDFRQGRVWLPYGGFGHGSGGFYVDTLRIAVRDPDMLDKTPRKGAIDDGRDTSEQFLVDEYSKWTPVRGSVLHDDGMDGLAWCSQQQYRSIFFGDEKPGVGAIPEYGLQTDHPEPTSGRRVFEGISNWAL